MVAPQRRPQPAVPGGRRERRDQAHAGKHALAFNGAAKPLAQLKPGQYAVVVEAAREVGGRELLRIPSMAAAEGRTAEARAASMSWAPSRWT